MMFPGFGLRFRALSAGAMRENPGRLLLAVLGVALGTALGVAVHLINASALNEFKLAINTLSGEADLVIRGPRGGFAESVYPLVARLPQVRAASPAMEVEAPIAGRRETLKIIGLDPFRAVQVQPLLLGALENRILDLFADDAVLLSRTAAEWLGLAAGDTLQVQVGTARVELRVAGLLPPQPHGQRMAMMDIATAQWRLLREGRLSRIDLRLRPGTDTAALQRELAALLPPGTQGITPQADVERSASISRAYRLNLDMLALVALFTGGFLVFSTQALSVLRRRSQFALLRVAGLTRSALTWMLVAEGALIGVLGATLGVLLGCALAAWMLANFGADLGAGYFRASSPALHIVPAVLAAFWMMGVAFAVTGALIPAVEAGRRAPGLALKAGDEEEALKKLPPARYGMVLIAAGFSLSLAPPVSGLPLPGYAAIALILFGAIVLMPWLATKLLPLLPASRPAPLLLACAQIRAAPRQAAVSIAAIVASFSLMVAMLIMVGSFRVSLDAWLTRMLPADLYVRAAIAGDTGFLTPAQQERIASTPGIAQIQFLRSQNLLLAADRPPVTLLARAMDAHTAQDVLPLIGPWRMPRAGEPPPAWVSEVVSDIFGYAVGDAIVLPLEGRSRTFLVAGIWRDYARQTGAIFIDREHYIRLTGDRMANDAALWLAQEATLQQVTDDLRQRLAQDGNIEISTAREIRLASLRIFDRTFAVTYALEIVAVLIGLFGISVGFSARALARRREFGVLRHVGMRRRDIGIMLGCEGILVTGLGAACGLVLGWLISLILVRVVNRQSFHWSVDMHIPWLELAALAVLLVAAAAVTAVWSGRGAMSGDVVRAVREDW